MLEMRGQSKLKNLNAEEIEAMRKVCKVRRTSFSLTPTHMLHLPFLSLTIPYSSSALLPPSFTTLAARPRSPRTHSILHSPRNYD
jgi:hypothetical protein